MIATITREEFLRKITTGAAAMGVCLRHTPLSAVREIALGGETMPHKSTYFYPKMATGVVLMSLE